MPYTRLSLKPGIDVESSPTASRGTWNTSNLIRWREGFPEKMRGWQQVGAAALVGRCRSVHWWVDLAQNQWLACGTTQGLYLEHNGALTSITPVGFIPGNDSSGGVPYSLMIWALDNFGQVLLAAPSGAGLYAWTPPDLTIPAQAVPTAPAVIGDFCINGQIQIVVAHGCTPLGGGTPDPLLVRWCDQSDYTQWIPSATNQAGSYRLPRGSRILGCVAIPNGAMIWTDLDAWIVQYIGFPLVFSFTQAGTMCGLISDGAATALGGVVYWMSDHGFFQYSPGGGMRQIPCPVWDVVFENLDSMNQDKCIAAPNYHYSTITWFYPSTSGGTGEIDSYVQFNFQENLWDYGSSTQYSRTAWTDQNRPGAPLGVDLNGLIMQHDSGVDANGSAMTGVSIGSGYSDLADGQQMLFVDQFIPDFLWDLSTVSNPSLSVTLLFRQWPGDTPTTEGPYTVTPTTEYLSFRTRAREVAIQIDCSTLGTWFRWGAPRLRIAPAGRV